MNAPFLPFDFFIKNNASLRIIGSRISAMNFSPRVPLMSFDSSSLVNITISNCEFDHFSNGVLSLSPSDKNNKKSLSVDQPQSFFLIESSKFDKNMANNGASIYIESSPNRKIEFISNQNKFSNNLANQNGGSWFISGFFFFEEFILFSNLFFFFKISIKTSTFHLSLRQNF